MRTFMDEVEYNATGNMVTLSKACAGNSLRQTPNTSALAAELAT
jgi:hypothetical protein